MSDITKRLDLMNVEKYDIKKDVWSRVPSLNEERMNHSSCVLDDKLIYTFCGYNSSNLAISSIECFKALEYLKGKRKEKWVEVELKSKLKIPARLDPIVCPLSETEIAVLGGFSSGKLSDGYILDTKSGVVKKQFD